MPKGLVRRITRNEALSYERSSPNGIGVTSIASVNGRGKFPAAVRRAQKECGVLMKDAWEVAKGGKSRARRNEGASLTPNYVRRYTATQQILRGGGRSRRNPADFSGFEGFGGLPSEIKKREKAEKRAAAAERRAEQAEERALMGRKERKMPKPKKKSAAKKPAAKKKAPGKTAKRGARRRTATGRSYGKFKPITVGLGRSRRPTFMYATRKGAAHIPIYAIQGFKSHAAFKKAQMEGDDKTKDKIRMRGDAIQRMRDRASARTKEHGDIFTPNTTVIPYSEWSKSMTPNKKAAKKKAAKKTGRKAKRSPKQIAASKRNIKGAQKASAAKRRGKGKKKAAKKGTKRAAAKRRPAKKGARKSAKRGGGKRTKASRRAAALKGIRAKKARGGRKAPKRKYSKNAAAVVATPNRRRRRAKHYEENRRRRPRHYAENRRRFRRNDYMAQLKDGLKTGAVIVGGFLIHKALSKVVNDQLLSRVEFFNGPSVAPYKGLIAGVLVAAAGIPLTAKFVKDQRTVNELAGGMAASLLHGAIMTVLGHVAAAAPALPYFAGTGEYVATQGYGEYIATQGYGGFGAYQQYGGPFQQAAAGYGAMMQAAAGPFQQAAAGYGLSQAAAGTGEFIASGAQGIGEYIATQGYGDASYTYDGIPGGDLSAAEHALNVAEAAAGLGFGDDAPDVGVQSMVNPLNPRNAGSVGPGMQQLPIQSLDQGVPGLPGPKATIGATPADEALEDGSSTGRRGVLGGGDGIFGGCSPMGGQRDWQ